MAWLLCRKPVKPGVSGSRITLNAGFEKDRLVNNTSFFPRTQKGLVVWWHSNHFQLKLEKKGTTSNFHLATAESSSWWVQASVHRGKKGFFGRMRIEWTTWSHLLDKLWAGSPRPKTLNLKPTCLFLVGLKGELEWKRGMTHVMLFFGRGCHVLKACLKSFNICPIVKDPTDFLKAFIATVVPRLTNPGGPLRVTTQRLGAEWVGGTYRWSNDREWKMLEMLRELLGISEPWCFSGFFQTWFSRQVCNEETESTKSAFIDMASLK